MIFVELTVIQVANRQSTATTASKLWSLCARNISQMGISNHNKQPPGAKN